MLASGGGGGGIVRHARFKSLIVCDRAKIHNNREVGTHTLEVERAPIGKRRKYYNI